MSRAEHVLNTTSAPNQNFNVERNGRHTLDLSHLNDPLKSPNRYHAENDAEKLLATTTSDNWTVFNVIRFGEHNNKDKDTAGEFLYAITKFDKIDQKHLQRLGIGVETVTEWNQFGLIDPTVEEGIYEFSEFGYKVAERIEAAEELAKKIRSATEPGVELSMEDGVVKDELGGEWYTFSQIRENSGTSSGAPYAGLRKILNGEFANRAVNLRVVGVGILPHYPPEALERVLEQYPKRRSEDESVENVSTNGTEDDLGNNGSMEATVFPAAKLDGFSASRWPRLIRRPRITRPTEDKVIGIFEINGYLHQIDQLTRSVNGKDKPYDSGHESDKNELRIISGTNGAKIDVTEGLLNNEWSGKVEARNRNLEWLRKYGATPEAVGETAAEFISNHFKHFKRALSLENRKIKSTIDLTEEFDFNNIVLVDFVNPFTVGNRLKVVMVDYDSERVHLKFCGTDGVVLENGPVIYIPIKERFFTGFINADDEDQQINWF